jgi:hypothetical protein
MLSEQKQFDEAISDEEINYTDDIKPGYSGEEEDPGAVMSFILHLVSFAFPILFTITIYYSNINLLKANASWSYLVAFAIAWYGSDFITGIVHWLCDTYGSVNTPIVGQTLIRHFRSHHRYPKDICISPFVYTIGNVALASAFTLPIAILLLIKFPSSYLIAFGSLTYALITLLTVLTNQFHKWAHLDNPGKLIKFMQRKRFILEPNHHKLHHTAPFNSYF